MNYKISVKIKNKRIVNGGYHRYSLESLDDETQRLFKKLGAEINPILSSKAEKQPMRGHNYEMVVDVKRNPYNKYAYNSWIKQFNEISKENKGISKCSQEKDFNKLKNYLIECSESLGEHSAHFLQEVLESNKNQIMNHSASYNVEHHHSEQGGLLHHLLEVVELASGIAVNNHNIDKKSVEYSLIIATAFFHDLGKILEFDSNGYHITQTDWQHIEQYMCGKHVVNCAEFVESEMRRLGYSYSDDSFFGDLYNAVLYHHNPGKNVTAKIVHEADIISAKEDASEKFIV